MIYLDNASTSFPKRPGVVRAVADYLSELGVSPGRGQYDAARRAENIVEQTRTMTAMLLGMDKPDAIAFTMNATHALNIAIKGMVRPAGRIIVTSFDHNSVVRPAYKVAVDRGAEFRVCPLDADGAPDLEALAELCRHPDVVVAATHASNVTGRVLPVADMARIVAAQGHRFILDVSQSAGWLRIRADAWQIGVIAGTGHKGIGGAQGVGFLAVRDDSAVEPLLEGGVGQNSISLHHPGIGHERYEAGTPNMPGISGLRAALRIRLDEGIGSAKLLHANAVMRSLLDFLSDHPDYHMVGRNGTADAWMPVVSFNLDGMAPVILADELARKYRIATRAGLHCAPLIHEALGTSPNGAVRISCSDTTTAAEIAAAVEALASIAEDFRANFPPNRPPGRTAIRSV
jgi:cysteine desulfurase / selenocysteine lyase